MLNPFKIKEILAFTVPQFITASGFMILLPMYGFFIASMSCVLLIILGVIIGKLLIRHPFLDMLKGDGVLNLPIDSRGFITPFLSRFQKGELTGNFQGEIVKAPFDRSMVFNMDVPEETKIYKGKDGHYYIRISKDEFNESRMGLYHFPVLIYNGMTKSYITKDWLSDRETETFSRHHIIHANRIAERLTEQITNFGRYIADNAMNKMQQIMQNPIIRYAIITLVIGLIGFLLLKFAPQIFDTATQTIDKAAISGNTIQPK